MDRYNQAYQHWLEKLTTMSLAALTLSVSLQNTYVPRNPQAGWLLCGAWGLLAVAVLAGLLALFGEARSHRLFQLRVQEKLLPALHTLRSNLAPVPSAQEISEMIGKVSYNRHWLYLSAAATAALALALAVVALAAFAIRNFPS